MKPAAHTTSIPDYSDTTAIIPTLNERKNIGTLLHSITSLYKGIKAIVSDDGSRDNTQLIVKSHAARNKNIKLIDRKNERVKGLTASVIDAVKIAETKYIIVIDGDLQHPPEKIKELHEKLQDCDIAGAARKKVLVKWPLHRKLMSMTATLLARARLARNIPDPLSGFFGARTELFRNTLGKSENKFEKQGYKVFFDLLKYSPKNAKTGYVFYDFGLRKGGESKIKMKHILIFFRSLLK